MLVGWWNDPKWIGIVISLCRYNNHTLQNEKNFMYTHFIYIKQPIIQFQTTLFYIFPFLFMVYFLLFKELENGFLFLELQFIRFKLWFFPRLITSVRKLYIYHKVFNLQRIQTIRYKFFDIASYTTKIFYYVFNWAY